MYQLNLGVFMTGGKWIFFKNPPPKSAHVPLLIMGDPERKNKKNVLGYNINASPFRSSGVCLALQIRALFECHSFTLVCLQGLCPSVQELRL